MRVTGEDEIGRLARQAYRHRHRAAQFLGTRPLLQSRARTGRRPGQGQSMIVAGRHPVCLGARRRGVRLHRRRRKDPEARGRGGQAAPALRVAAAQLAPGRRARSARMSRSCSRTWKRTAPPRKNGPPCAAGWNRPAFPRPTPATFWIICGRRGGDRRRCRLR